MNEVLKRSLSALGRLYRISGRGHKLAGLCLLLPLFVLAACLVRARALASDEYPARVLITEFMAVNDGTLLDQDGDPADWIELYNPGTRDLDLEGWYLTDDRRDLTKWRFPPSTLAANGYLVLFASGQDRALAGSALHTNFKLVNERGYLALVAPNGRTIVWEFAPAYPAQFADVSYGLVADLLEGYLVVPTPGRANGAAVANRGPILSQVHHTPSLPSGKDPIVVNARVTASYAPLDAVTLNYRVMYGVTSATPMFDDGTHRDKVAGDGVYTAVIPAIAHKPGDMVRYTVTATDSDGNLSRWPLFHDPLDSPEYLGTIIADPGVDTRLPVLHWFVADPIAAETDAGTRASLFYDGIFYDNILVRRRGMTSRYWPKKNYKFDLNQGHHFRFSPDEDPVQEFNLNATFSDKAYIRQVLTWETYRDAGVPHAISFFMRVQQNGAFHSVAAFVEQPDERYLERQGLDPEGALYKMKLFNLLESSTVAVEKRTRLGEDHSDLQALIDGINLPAEERTAFLFDHVNLPALIHYLAVATVVGDRDHGHNNYFMYHDTEGTGEWIYLPWDKDMTFGRNYLHDQGGTFNDVIWADHDPECHPLAAFTENYLIDALYDTPVLREMFLRHLRTVMDAYLQPPTTPARDLWFEQRIDELVAQIESDVALDTARWPIDWGEPQTLAQAIEVLKTDYLAARRVHLYNTHGAANGGIIPDAQADDVRVYFGDIAFDPASGDPDQEYLTLVNPNAFAVDVSGWQVAYDVEHVFQPGAVIPAGGTLHVSPNVAAFRNRATSPTGGEGHFVQGNYRGRLSKTWGVLRLYNANGRLVTTKVFSGLGPSR